MHTSTYSVKSVIVLVGTTGSGKSTVANLLVDPNLARDIAPDDDLEKELPQKEEIFRIGHTNSSCTDSIKSACTVDNPLLEVIDTPGFDESTEKDIKHTIELLTKLKKTKYISAVIMCHSGKAEEKFRKLLEYISKLFTKQVMENNFFLLYTKMSTSGRSMKEYPYNRRRSDMIHVQKIVRSIIKTKNYTKIFQIDSCPPKNKLLQWNATLEQRKNILATSINMKHVDVSKLQFPKSQQTLNMNKIELNLLQLEKTRIYKNIDTNRNQRENDAYYLYNLKEKLQDIRSKIRTCKDKIKHLDTNELVLTGQEYGYSSMGNTYICVDTLYPMANGSSGYSLSNIEDYYSITYKSDNRIIVKITPDTPIFGQTRGTVTCYSLKNVVNADTIKNLRMQLSEHENQEITCRSDICNTEVMINTKDNIYCEFNKRINEIDRKIEYLEKEYIEFSELTAKNYASVYHTIIS